MDLATFKTGPVGLGTHTEIKSGMDRACIKDWPYQVWLDLLLLRNLSSPDLLLLRNLSSPFVQHGPTPREFGKSYSGIYCQNVFQMAEKLH